MSTQTSIYKQECFDLARTIKLKSKILANNIELNVGQQLNNAAWEETPLTEWRYYLNLNGQYHSLDTVMTVISLDTQEEIEFTKDNLINHPTTKREYAFGTNYYNELVNRYPNQEHLIISILNPVDLDYAINADDLTIVWYNSNLVEEAETNLISELQKFIYKFAKAHNNTSYVNYETNFSTKWMFELALQIYLQIYYIRLNNCKTEYAHSFHIWSYLDGYQKLGRYKTSMTQRQIRYLYRNIERIHNNAGSDEILSELIQVFFTERDIPLYNYYARHNIEHHVDECLPDTKMIRTRYGDKGGVVAADNISTIEQLMDREVSKSADNGAQLTKDTNETKEAFDVSSFDKVSTRVFEVETKTTTSLQDFSLDEWLVDLWAILAQEDIYQTTISFENPITDEVITLNEKDAFILYLYCYYRQFDIELEYVPVYWTRMGYNPNPINRDALAKTIPSGFLPDGYLTQMLTDLPVIAPVQTNDAFFALVNQMYLRWDRHIREFRSISKLGGSSIGNILVSNLYASWKIDLVGSNILFSNWLYSKNLNFDQYTTEHFVNLTELLFKEGTGRVNNEDVSSRSIQKAMVNIVSQLSGYNLQFLEITPQDETITLARKAVRYDDLRIVTESTPPSFSTGIYLNKVRGKKDFDLNNRIDIKPNYCDGDDGLGFVNREQMIVVSDINLNYTLSGASKSTDMGQFRMGISYSNLEIV